MGKIVIRKAVKADSRSLLKLINELAKFEKLKQPDLKAQRRLLKDAFTSKPPFKILLAESDSIIVGYSFYLYTYSSFLAKKTLYLEDIFVLENYRGMGIGKLFFNELMKIARRNKCGRMEWAVLDWNRNAIEFYDKLGAKQLKEWKIYRLNFTKIE